MKQSEAGCVVLVIYWSFTAALALGARHVSAARPVVTSAPALRYCSWQLDSIDFDLLSSFHLIAVILCFIVNGLPFVVSDGFSYRKLRTDILKPAKKGKKLHMKHFDHCRVVSVLVFLETSTRFVLLFCL